MKNMAEKVLHVIIKILMYIFIVLLFILLFVRMSEVGRAIFADKPKDKNPQIASETVLVVEQGNLFLRFLRFGRTGDCKESVSVCHISSLHGWISEYPARGISGFLF